jgi:hypothetical protein
MFNSVHPFMGTIRWNNNAVLCPDTAYRSLVEQIDALAVVAALQGTGSTVGDAAVFNAFIASLNTLIERYNNTLAVRQGRAKAKKEEEPAAEDTV